VDFCVTDEGDVNCLLRFI